MAQISVIFINLCFPLYLAENYFVVMVHIFSVNGINLAYDGESGNLFEVDAVTALLLKGEDVSGYSQDDIAAARREIESLKRGAALYKPAQNKPAKV